MEDEFTLDPSIFSGAPRTDSSRQGGYQTVPDQQPAAPATTAGDSSFGLGDIEAILAEQSEINQMNTRIANEANQQIAQQSRIVRDSAAEYANQAKVVNKNLDQILAQREEALRLANSNNPIDRITLLGAQISNPSAFTRDGRQQRAQELSSLLALRGQVHNVRVTEAEANVANIQATAAAKQFQGETALDRLRTRVEVMNLAGQQVAATEQLRASNLTKQTRRTLVDTMAAGPDGAGFYNIGGFKYDELEIKERARNLQERELISKLPVNGLTSEALAAHQQLTIETMNLDDLMEVRDSGYMVNGTRAPQEMVESAITLQTQLAAERQSRIAATGQATQMLNSEYERSIGLIDSLGAQFPPTTAVGQAVQKFKLSVNGAANLNETKFETKVEREMAAVQQMAMLGEAQKNLYAAIEKEVKIQAKGDSALEPILMSKMLGQPVDPSQIYSYAAEAYASNKPFARAIDIESATRIQQTADAIYAQSTTGANAFDLDSEGKKSLRREAFYQAWSHEQESQGIENLSLAENRAMTDPTNPLVAANMTPGKYSQLQGEIEQRAASVIMQQEDLSPEDYKAVMEDRSAEVGIPASRASDIKGKYNTSLVFAAYDILDRETGYSGVAEAYADWLADNLTKHAKVVNGRHGSNAILFEQSTRDQIGATVAAWGAAADSATDRAREVAVNQALKINDPLVRFPAIIDSVRDMPNEMKAAVYYDIVIPALDMAKQQRMNNDQTMQFVIQQLEAGVEGNVALSNAAKSLVRAMPGIVATQDAMRRSILDEARTNRSTFGSFLGEPTARELMRDRDNEIPWLRK